MSVLPVLAGLIFISCSEETPKEVANLEKTEVTEVQKIDAQDVPSQPEFPGGMEAFSKFVVKEFKMPKTFDGQGNVIASFIVEPDGSLSNIKIVKDLGSGTGDEVVRLLEKSPKWKPGFLKGKAVKVQYHLPIKLDTSKK